MNNRHEQGLSYKLQINSYNMFIFLTEMKKMQKYAGETTFNIIMCIKYFLVCRLQSLEKEQ